MNGLVFHSSGWKSDGEYVWKIRKWWVLHPQSHPFDLYRSSLSTQPGVECPPPPPPTGSRDWDISMACYPEHAPRQMRSFSDGSWSLDGRLYEVLKLQALRLLTATCIDLCNLDHHKRHPASGQWLNQWWSIVLMSCSAIAAEAHHACSLWYCSSYLDLCMRVQRESKTKTRKR